MNRSVDVALHTYSLRMHYLRRDNYDVFAFIDDAVSQGFSGVNISLSGPDYRHLSGSSPKHIRAVRRRIDAEGLTLEVDTDSVEPGRLADILGVAERLGARKIRTFTHHPFGTRMQADTISDIKRSIALAESLGIAICLENHEEFTSAELAEIAATIDSPRFQLLFDFGNSLPVLEHPETAFANMSPWLGAVHVKDEKLVGKEASPAKVPTMLGVPLGAGRIDVTGLLAKTLETGLARICLQNVWGYSVPLGKLRPVDLDALPEGRSFELSAHDNGDAMQCFDAEVIDGESALTAERRALQISVADLADRLQSLGWTCQRPLRTELGRGGPWI